VDDRKDVITELLLGRNVRVIIEDDDASSIFLKDKSEEVKGETTQSVFMGNKQVL